MVIIITVMMIIMIMIMIKTIKHFRCWENPTNFIESMWEHIQTAAAGAKPCTNCVGHRPL